MGGMLDSVARWLYLTATGSLFRPCEKDSRASEEKKCLCLENPHPPLRITSSRPVPRKTTPPCPVSAWDRDHALRHGVDVYQLDGERAGLHTGSDGGAS